MENGGLKNRGRLTWEWKLFEKCIFLKAWWEHFNIKIMKEFVHWSFKNYIVKNREEKSFLLTN